MKIFGKTETGMGDITRRNTEILFNYVSVNNFGINFEVT